MNETCLSKYLHWKSIKSFYMIKELVLNKLIIIKVFMILICAQVCTGESELSYEIKE